MRLTDLPSADACLRHCPLACDVLDALVDDRLDTFVCGADLGDWGAWRAVAAPLAQGYARAMARPACLAYMRARLMFEARATLPAAGWSA